MDAVHTPRPRRLSTLALPLATVLVAAAAALAQGGTAPASSASPAKAAAAAPLADTLPPVSAEALAHTCSACHGTFGRLGDEAFMPLAGMPAAQFVATMQDFRSGQRPATLMGHVARGLSDADLRGMAAWFEQQTPAAGSAAAFIPPALHGAAR
jgi:sulfide dehydrogenase cytochrome subunit